VCAHKTHVGTPGAYALCLGHVLRNKTFSGLLEMGPDGLRVTPVKNKPVC
jgi:hypothetical protein